MSTPARMAWLALALTPALLVHAISQGGAWLVRACGIVLLAFALDAAASALRGAAGRRVLSDASPAVTALLVLLCLPASAPFFSVALALAVALLLGKHAFGGLGENPFNPAMLGVAAIAIALPAGLHASPVLPWLAPAYLAGGMALLATRVIGWQAPLGVLAGTAMAAPWVGSFATVPATLAAALASPAVLLAAFFVATDPVSGCAYPRARLLFGLGVGAMMFLIERWRPGLGLPCAILMMNFMAPWLDRVVAPAHRGAAR